MARFPFHILAASGALAALLFSGCARQFDSTPRSEVTVEGRTPVISRIAPDFTFRGASAHTLRALRGQAVVLIITDSPRNKAYRKQIRNLDELYSEFASRQAVFVVAFEQGEGDTPVQSNVPFAVANNGAAVAAAYGMSKDKFNIVVIGKDGNLDYQTYKILSGERVRDVIQNSYTVQTAARKQSG